MIWLIFVAIATANGQQNTFLASSLPDAVRVGATIVSRFLNPKPPRLRFSGFYNFIEETADKGTRKGHDRNGLILAILRLMGVDSRKINDFAFDGIISMVHLMSQVFLKDGGTSRKGRKTAKDFSFFRFILGQPQVAELLNDIQNPNLVDLLLKESKDKLKTIPEANAECIHLLLCKTKPIVWGMQRSLRFFMNRENVTTSDRGNPNFSAEEGTCSKESPEESCRKEDDARWEEENLDGRMYFFLPGLGDVIEKGDECDQLFPNCVY